MYKKSFKKFEVAWLENTSGGVVEKQKTLYSSNSFQYFVDTLATDPNFVEFVSWKYPGMQGSHLRRALNLLATDRKILILDVDGILN